MLIGALFVKIMHELQILTFIMVEIGIPTGASMKLVDE